MNPSDIDQLHEILPRLCAAALAGAILGINRDLHHKPAGLRVLPIVSLGACAIIMASITAASSLSTTPNDGVSKTIQGILSGIGFLGAGFLGAGFLGAGFLGAGVIGAGVIMRLQGKDEVHGITTASSIWLRSIIGMICAMGEWVLGLTTFSIAWIVLVFGSWLEFKIIRSVVAKPINTESETKNAS